MYCQLAGLLSIDQRSCLDRAFDDALENSITDEFSVRHPDIVEGARSTAEDGDRGKAVHRLEDLNLELGG